MDLPASETDKGAMCALFAEELGLVLEVTAKEAAAVAALYNKAGLKTNIIGKVGGQLRRAVLCLLPSLSLPSAERPLPLPRTHSQAPPTQDR